MDIYAEVTERIIQQMEQGEVPWEKPWVGQDSIVSHATGKGYSLLNQILIGKPGEYATFKQVQTEGGHVKKGAKSRLVVFWKILEREDESGSKEEFPYLKYSRVFNLNDCEGVKAKYVKDGPLHDNKPIEKAQSVLDSYVGGENIKLKHDGRGGAYYRPSEDMIHLPLLESFCNSESYYDTAFHECVHSTGAFHRLNRPGVAGVTNFGSENIARKN